MLSHALQAQASGVKLLAVDPGNSESGAVLLDGVVVAKVWPRIENDRLVDLLRDTYHHIADELVIEMPRARGMPTANQEFETCVVIGWLEMAFGRGSCSRVFRHQVKQAICGRATANDANISAAVRDLYPQLGGGSRPAVGTKAQPGPLYGVSKDAWQALALGLTHLHLSHALELDAIERLYTYRQRGLEAL